MHVTLRPRGGVLLRPRYLETFAGPPVLPNKQAALPKACAVLHAPAVPGCLHGARKIARRVFVGTMWVNDAVAAPTRRSGP